MLMKRTTKQKERVIRVFISSTFKDMMEERNILVKNIFPQLRKLCDERHVVWGEVDLRWGITEEQAAEGKVLPICLNEIKNCRPYFIGLLGERYGWVPETIDEGLVEQEKWLTGNKGLSVTELEILHGVLNNPEMADNAFFYFRDKNYLDTIPQEKLSDFVDEKDGKVDIELQAKLFKLKKHILNSPFPTVENYKNAEALGQMILEDMIRVIEQEFPEEEIPDPLAQQAIEHEAYAYSRHRVYIGRKEYYDRLEEHVQSNNCPLVLTGASGSGKSALLSNWAFRYKDKNPNEHIIIHFVGSLLYSANWITMVRRIMGELKQRFDIPGDIPDKSEELRATFPQWLGMAAVKGRCIIVIDAVNQLEDKDLALELAWLPQKVPNNIRLILSTLPGKSLDEIQKRDWEIFAVEPFTKNERKDFIKKYLEQYTKQLNDELIEKIVEKEQTAIPLYLQVLLEELRLYGDHFTLVNKTENYLKAETISELYQKILARYEEDYELERKALVKDAFSLVWASRRGLSETELLELLGIDGHSLPRAIWAPLYFGANQSIINRIGLLDFSHDYLRQAVEERYLQDKGKQRRIHLLLADYFSEKTICNRQIEELPWHYVKAEDWRQLKHLLSNLDFCKAICETDQFEIKEYWTKLEKNSEFSIISAYKQVLDEPLKFLDYISDIIHLLQHFAHVNEAYNLAYAQYEHYANIGDIKKFSSASRLVIVMMLELGEIGYALKASQQLEKIYKEFSDEKGLEIAYSYQAECYKAYGEFEKTIDYYSKCIEINRVNNNEASSVYHYINLATVYSQQESYEEVIKLLDKAEEIAIRKNDITILSTIRNNKGLALTKMGKPEDAILLHKMDEEVCIKYGDKSGLSQCYDNIAVAYTEQENHQKALKYRKMQIDINIQIGYISKIADSVMEYGNNLMLIGNNKEAIESFKYAEDLSVKSKNNTMQTDCIHYRIIALLKDNQYDKALELSKYLFKIYNKKKLPKLAKCLGNYIYLLIESNKFKEVIPFFDSIEQVYVNLEQKAQIQPLLAHKALILKNLKRYAEAVICFEKEKVICEELQMQEQLAENYLQQGKIFFNENYEDSYLKLEKGKEIWYDLKNSKKIYEIIVVMVQLELKWEHYNKAIENMNEQISILKLFNAKEEALKVYKNQEEVYSHIDDKKGLYFNLTQQSQLLTELDKPINVLELHDTIMKLCFDINDNNGLYASYCIQIAMLFKLGRNEETLRVLKKQAQLAKENGIEIEEMYVELKQLIESNLSQDLKK